VTEIKPIKIPKFPVFRGKKAIRVLHYITNELEEQRCEELTEKQAAALIKITKGLISSIELEMCAKEKPRRFKLLNKNSDILDSGAKVPPLSAIIEPNTRILI